MDSSAVLLRVAGKNDWYPAAFGVLQEYIRQGELIIV